jgi:hypothetical protein
MWKNKWLLHAAKRMKAIFICSAVTTINSAWLMMKQRKNEHACEYNYKIILFELSHALFSSKSHLYMNEQRLFERDGCFWFLSSEISPQGGKRLNKYKNMIEIKFPTLVIYMTSTATLNSSSFVDR